MVQVEFDHFEDPGTCQGRISGAPAGPEKFFSEKIDAVHDNLWCKSNSIILGIPGLVRAAYRGCQQAPKIFGNKKRVLETIYSENIEVDCFRDMKMCQGRV